MVNANVNADEDTLARYEPRTDLVCVAQMSQNNTCVSSTRHFRQNAVNTRWACVWRRNKHKTNDCFLGLIFEIRKRQRFYILRRQLWEIKIWERNCQHNGEWFKRVWPTGVTFFIKKCFLYSIPSKYCFLFCFSFLVKHLFKRNRTGYTRQGKQKQNPPFRLWIFNTINTEQQMFVVNFCKQKHPFWTTELHGHGVSSANQQQKKDTYPSVVFRAEAFRMPNCQHTYVPFDTNVNLGLSVCVSVCHFWSGRRRWSGTKFAYAF